MNPQVVTVTKLQVLALWYIAAFILRTLLKSLQLHPMYVFNILQ